MFKEIEIDKPIFCKRFSSCDTIFQISFSDLPFYNLVSVITKDMQARASHFPPLFITVNHTFPGGRDLSSRVFLAKFLIFDIV